MEMTYTNIDDHKKLLLQTVCADPEWGASRILECERLEAVVIPELRDEIASLREHLRIEREAQAKKLDSINTAFNKLREALSQ